MTINKRHQDRTGQLSTHNIFLSNSCRSDAVYPKIKNKIVIGSSKLNCLRQYVIISILPVLNKGGSVAEWLACWTQAQKGPGSNRSRDAVG